MIDRYTVVYGQVRNCPDCGADTTWSVMDSEERGYLGFDGQERSCDVCGRTEQIRRDGDDVVSEDVVEGYGADEISEEVPADD